MQRLRQHLITNVDRDPMTSNLSPAKRDLLKQHYRDQIETLQHRERVALARANPARALKNLKDAQRRRRAALLDPKWGDDRRHFPQWKPGMTTVEYIRLYKPSCVQRIVTYTVEVGDARLRPAPFYEQDPLL